MKIKILIVFFIALVAVNVGSLVEASVDGAISSKCVIRGEADRKIYVYCPAELSQSELLKEVIGIRDTKTTDELKDIGIFVFSSENSPRNHQEFSRLPERNVQKIQSAVYMNYPNGETDYFCKRDGKMQKCKELLRTHQSR